MIYAYKPNSKNTRWPFPTLHIFTSELQEFSSCGRVKKGDDRYIFSDTPPLVLVTCCEHCFYNRPSLKEKAYS